MVARLLLASIALCAGCDLVFPLREPSGAAADGGLPPTMCPADHGAPSYDRELTKLHDDVCFQYSESAELAVCFDFAKQFREGALGEPLGLATLEPPIAAGSTQFGAVISPDGMQLITLISVENAPPPTIEVYGRKNGIWQHVSTSPSVTGAVMGVPSHGPAARILIHDPQLHRLVELEQQPDSTWITLRVSPLEALGAIQPESTIINLSPDGHRMTFKRTDDEIGYAYRDSLDDDFENVTLLDSPGHASANFVFMSENCDRLVGSFFSGGIFVAPQI